MFGPVNPNEIPPEICTGNCPRIYPPLQLAGDDGEDEESVKIPEEYDSEIGKKLYPERLKPCYLFVKHTRQYCRSLRNYIISNSSKLEVIDGLYCGISTKVFNINNHTIENQTSIGMLRFKTTDQAYRFVMGENKMTRQEFLGGKFDIWNLTMCAEDRCIVSNPSNPDKFVNDMNVFHFIHIKKISLLPDNLDETTEEARRAAVAAVEQEKAALEEALKLVEKYQGRVVVKTDTMARIRGLPLTNKPEEPQKYVYLTQWKGVYFFWEWFESADGKRFLAAIKEYTGGDYQSLLFTCCLDFHDLM